MTVLFDEYKRENRASGGTCTQSNWVKGLERLLALLPQFVSAKAGHPVLQMVVLGSVFMLQAVVTFTLIALFAGNVGQKLLQHPRMNGYINKGKAGLFAIIGIRIALAEK
ncbi:LysE family translocator [Bacillus songklensis]|uniref:LysE family translocator n=1 Tax=Bacillus songklensis TaxID=1069116 RepID=A0ABV8B8C3_9BACI